jgi:light-regulated signal transduction histidine kinase (bacteriophytochrome)
MTESHDDFKKELDELTYAVSHDLREPLRTVKSYTNLLLEELSGKLDGNAKEFFDFIVDGADRMDSLIADLLESSRIGTAEIKLKEFDPKGVFDNILEKLSGRIEKSGAVVSVGELPKIKADLKLFWKLLEHIVDNAIKFTDGKKPVVEIAAVQENKNVIFSVKDNGIGIPKEHWERIFVVFQRLHTAAEYPGNGIGLTLCSKIIRRHAGKIWLDSEVGKGSTFYISFPQ